MSKRWVALLTLGLFGITLLSFAAGYWAREVWPLDSEQLVLLREARRLLEIHYIDPLPDEIELERGMIHGMMVALGDPYSIYVEPDAHEIQSDDLSGEYACIGAEISKNEQGQFYLVPIAGGPADTAGIHVGDILLAIDGEFLSVDASLESVISRIRGPEGSKIRITIASRATLENDLEFEITREAIPLPSVTYHILPEEEWIGIIAIRRFSEKTPVELEQAYTDLIDRGARSFILDLRDNSGGLLEASVETSRLFLEAGCVVFEERAGEESQVFYVQENGSASEIPMIVLVNGGTASAAEMVAASFQDNQRASLLGEKTFGKGSVQAIIELQDGSSLHVTSARWLTPNGNMIDRIGLLPDILIKRNASSVDNIIAAAVDWLRELSEDGRG